MNVRTHLKNTSFHLQNSSVWWLMFYCITPPTVHLWVIGCKCEMVFSCMTHNVGKKLLVDCDFYQLDLYEYVVREDSKIEHDVGNMTRSSLYNGNCSHELCVSICCKTSPYWLPFSVGGSVPNISTLINLSGLLVGQRFNHHLIVQLFSICTHEQQLWTRLYSSLALCGQ